MDGATFWSLNSAEAFSGALAPPRIRRVAPVSLLPLRLVLFAAFQALFAVLLWTRGGSFDLEGARLYWPFAAFGANLVTVLALYLVFRAEGLRLVDLYHFSRGSVVRDLLVSTAFFVVVAPIAYLPNVWLAGLLFGDSQATAALMFGALPKALAYASVLFPATIAFAELPLYMGYIMPRLSALLRSRAASVAIVALFLALQHCTLPLVLDMHYLAWRFGMFVPLALAMAVVLTWRPRLLPYFMIGHALLDLSMVPLIVSHAA